MSTPSALQQIGEIVQAHPDLDTINDSGMTRIAKLIADHEAAMEADRQREAAAEAAAKAIEAKRQERRQRAQQKRDAYFAKCDAERAERAKTFKPPYFSFGPSNLDITCGNPACRYQGDAGEFCTTRFGQERGPDEIQCPKCSWAVKRVAVNGQLKLVPIQPTL